jgi:hypothetical protein
VPIKADRVRNPIAPAAALAARVPNPVGILLGLAVAASGALLLALGSRLTFLLDDWEFLLYRPGFTAHSILTPHNEHISIAPILIYKALVATVGMSSALPFRVVSTAVFLAGCVILFFYLRPRLGQWLALLATALILFLGAAWEDLLWSFQIGFMGSITCGLGALLALDRKDRNGDVAACLLLTLGLTFSSLGLPFLAGAAVNVGLRRNKWRRRLYVVAVPAVFYACWWVGWGHTAHTDASLHNFANTPRYVVDAAAAGISSLLGLATPAPETSAAGGLDWGRPLLLLGLVLGAWRLRQLRRVPAGLWTVLAIGIAFWILAGVNVVPSRGPTASRYQLAGAIFVLLIAAELLRGVRIGGRAILVAYVIGAAAILSNLSYLHQAYLSYKGTSDIEKADLGAVEIARARVSPSFVLSPEVADTAYVHVDAGTYLRTADAHGSPADTPAGIAAAPEPARLAADKVLQAALGVTATKVRHPPPASGPPPRLISPAPSPGAGTGSGSCLSLPPATAPAVLQLPPGGAIVRTGAGGTSLSLRRFATESFPLQAGTVPAGSAAILRIPTDGASVPWQLEVDPPQAVTVCGLSAR